MVTVLWSWSRRSKHCIHYFVSSFLCLPSEEENVTRSLTLMLTGCWSLLWHVYNILHQFNITDLLVLFNALMWMSCFKEIVNNWIFNYSTDCLRPFIQLLSVISEDRKLKEYLEKNAKTASTNLQNSQTSQASVGSISDPLRDSEIVEKVTTEDLPVVSF